MAWQVSSVLPRAKAWGRLPLPLEQARQRLNASDGAYLKDLGTLTEEVVCYLTVVAIARARTKPEWGEFSPSLVDFFRNPSFGTRVECLNRLEVRFPGNVGVLEPLPGRQARPLRETWLAIADARARLQGKGSPGRPETAPLTTISVLRTIVEIRNALLHPPTLTHDQVARLAPLVRQVLEDIVEALGVFHLDLLFIPEIRETGRGKEYRAYSLNGASVAPDQENSWQRAPAQPPTPERIYLRDNSTDWLPLSPLMEMHPPDSRSGEVYLFTRIDSHGPVCVSVDGKARAAEEVSTVFSGSSDSVARGTRENSELFSIAELLRAEAEISATGQVAAPASDHRGRHDSLPPPQPASHSGHCQLPEPEVLVSKLDDCIKFWEHKLSAEVEPRLARRRLATLAWVVGALPVSVQLLFGQHTGPSFPGNGATVIAVLLLAIPLCILGMPDYRWAKSHRNRLRVAVARATELRDEVANFQLDHGALHGIVQRYQLIRDLLRTGDSRPW